MNHRNKFALAFLAVLLAISAVRFWATFRTPPQLPANPKVFLTVDGLFTAVTAHDERRLVACEAELAQFKIQGNLPPAAAKRLDRIISTARAGDWDAAARRLYEFMHGQRGDNRDEDSVPRQTAMR